jgi:putative Ca2+/H+ antiporter (TMEM165/GDT1 family)
MDAALPKWRREGVDVAQRAPRRKWRFSKRHGLSLVVMGILLFWIVMYHFSDEQGHWGSFFGNAIADWSGVLLMVLATKHLYERHSAESKKEPRAKHASKAVELIREHSLSIFLIVTGAGWVALFAHSNPQGKWGQVVGNIVSEWTQALGLVVLTKKLIEAGSEESGKKG